MKWAGYVATGEVAYRDLVGKPEGNRPRGDPSVDGKILK
jgi:hypothetical protein